MMKSFLSTTLALSLVIGAGFAIDAKANSTIYLDTTQTRGQLSVVQPADKDLLISVNNPTASPVRLVVPDAGLDLAVNPDSEETFYINLAHIPDDDVEYLVMGPSGQTIATGMIDNLGLELSEIEIATTEEIDLRAFEEPEPVYYTTQPTPQPVQQQQAVRGYW